MELKKTFLSIGIAILFVIFIAYGLTVVYGEPKIDREYNDCYQKTNCDQIIFDCHDDLHEQNISKDYKYDECEDLRNSDEYKNCSIQRDACNDEYEEYLTTTPRFKHKRNSFYILWGIALLAIIGGIYLKQYDSVGSGFIGGGILVLLWTLIYTSDYWLQFNKYLRLIAIGIVLVTLVYLGYKKIDTPAKKVITIKSKPKKLKQAKVKPKKQASRKRK